MRLATYDDGRGPRPALQRSRGAELIDIGALAAMAGLTDVLGQSRPGISAALNVGADQAARLFELVDKYEDRLRADDSIHTAETVRLLSPVPRPEKIICIGLNYHDPPGVTPAQRPITFLKPGDTVEVDIEDVGVLSNPIGEPVGTPVEPDAVQAVP